MTLGPRQRHRRRPSVLLAGLLAIGVTLVQPTAYFGVAGPLTAQAADPTPGPSDPGASPSSEPTPAPTAAATDGPTEPTPDPGAGPAATFPPDPTAAPTPPPTPSQDAAPTIPPTSSPTSSASEPLATATPLIAYRLSGGQQAGAAVDKPVPIYRLVTPSGPVLTGSPHGISGLDSPACAACHAAHTATGPALAKGATQNELCLRCHSTGDPFDVAAQFAGLPANDEATASYFSHPVSAATAAQHSPGAFEEFGATLDRHSVCVDCHNPHDANGARPQLTTTGWTASGDVRAAAGVAVVNRATGQAPAYALVSRDTGASLTFEYQLCLKCHSGYTVLPTRSTSKPSWWALDKGIELNPANTSYHPVEAGGKNLSAQMAGSLAGTSPFKAWDFTVDSTVRCTNCHGDPSTVNQTPSGDPLRPAADAYQPSHGSPNRGILISPYRDRVLKAAGEPYSAQDFALCYLCHAERPFVDPNNQSSAADTAFPAHGLHVSAIGGVPGSGSSIDQPAAGEGLAICAECHFRVHSTAEGYKAGDTSPTPRSNGYAGLVNFAPNVTAAGGIQPTWVQPNASGQGSCTLTCHGYTHATTDYTTAPGTAFAANPTVGPVGSTGLTVQFSDQTRYVGASGTAWSWQFGDGATSSARNPSHTYSSPGTYSVTLTVRRTSGNSLSMTVTKSSFITVTP